MIIWGSSNPVRARIFHQSSASHLQPEYGSPTHHYFKFNSNPFPLNERELPIHTNVELNSNEYIFVPHQYLAAFEFPHEGELGDQKFSLLKACVFDASNINEVRELVQMEGFLSAKSKVVSHLLSSPSLFKFTMEKDVNELTYSQWRAGKVTSETGDSSTSAESTTVKSRDRSVRGGSGFKGIII